MSKKTDNILWNIIVTLFKLSAFIIVIIASIAITVFLLVEGLNYEQRLLTVWIIGILLVIALMLSYTLFGRWLFNQPKSKNNLTYMISILTLFMGVGLFWYYINQHALTYMLIMQEDNVDKRAKLLKKFIVKDLNYTAVGRDKRNGKIIIKEHGVWKNINYDFFQK